MGDYIKKPRDVGEAMLHKEQAIKEAQSRKQNSMEMLACFRDATLLTVAQVQGKNLDVEDIETAWEFWHDWLEGKLNKEILGF